MTATDADRPPTAPQRGLRGWVQHHPVAAFFVLAYALSWLVWIPAALTGAGQVLLVAGAFGPGVAAYIVIRATGGSVGAWAHQILHWRVKPRWYLYALGLPAVLFAAVNGVLALLGEAVDLSLLAERAPSYLAGFAFVALLGGGQEEPGWRGFALPRLQQRLTPLRATLLLAVLWGLWHLPIYGIGFVGPMLFAFFYTYLYNRTGSVGLCMLLHGSFTAALDNLTLTTDSLTVDLTIAATLLAGTLTLIAVTRGRLGYQPSRAETPHTKLTSVDTTERDASSFASRPSHRAGAGGAAAGPGPTVDGTDLRHKFRRQPVAALGARALPRRPRPARATRTRGGRAG